MKEIKVPLGDRSYTITIGNKALKGLSLGLKKYLRTKKIIILTNKTIAALYQQKINFLLKKDFELGWILIPDGERFKTLKTMEHIYHHLIHLGANRQTGLLALGGGVVGDIGGFAAATFLRGIPFIQIPTTLLSQVDSSVGGKTGVDLPSGKNLVGAFYQPSWVLIDTNFLKTLSNREFLCGLAEVIKYGILGDSSFFHYLEKNRDSILGQDSFALEYIIARSVSNKAKIVVKDEKESSGLRALLNLGHTLGHAIETLSGYKKFHHGEAISCGMAYAGLLSVQKGFCSPNVAERILKILKSYGLPTKWPHLPKNQYQKVIAVDKKALEGTINYVAIKEIGKAFTVPLSPKEITEYL